MRRSTVLSIPVQSVFPGLWFPPCFPQCSRSDVPRSRQKRIVNIPNLTTLGFSSRLIVPQPPIGFYIIWIKTRGQCYKTFYGRKFT